MPKRVTLLCFDVMDGALKLEVLLFLMGTKLLRGYLSR